MADAANKGLINDFGSSTEFGNVGTAVDVAGSIGGNVGWLSVAADCDAAAAASIKSSSSFGTNPRLGRYSNGNTEREKSLC